MDEATFRVFLEEHQDTLASLDKLLLAEGTSFSESPRSIAAYGSSLSLHPIGRNKLIQLRLDDACRGLADAYVTCDARQRAVIRELTKEFRAFFAHMTIPANGIAKKSFRLGLIYESVKDMRPDAADAVHRLRQLCRAAIEAGIDVNPHLREVADLSNNTMHSGNKESMRETLLAMLSPEATPNDTPVYLPTPTLVGYVILGFATILLLIMASQEIVWTFQRQDYHLTRGAWSSKAVILMLVAALFSFRSSLTRAVGLLGKGRRLCVTLWQAILLIAVLFGINAALVFLTTHFASTLGW